MANKHFTFQNVRFLYPAILRPKTTYAGDGEEYSVVMLISKNDKPQLKRFINHYNELVATEFKTKPANLRLPIGSSMQKAVLKDGDEKYNSVDIDKKPNYEAYQGHYFANLSLNVTQGKVEAVDIDRQPIISTEQFPSGAKGHIVVECSAYKSSKFGPQFSVRPVLIQVTDISEPIGTPRLSADEAMKLLPGDVQNDLDDLLGDDPPF